MDAALHSGERFGKYRIEGILGEGGMGSVFRARGDAGEVVALKVLRSELARDETYRKRFMREATMARKVDHPHVVAVLEHGDVGGTLYLTQQLFEGGALSDWIARDGRLSVEATVRLCREVAGALEAMHAVELIHRDVKPQNIMISPDGGALVTDFGLAKDRKAKTVLTRLGQAVGSMDYMAPEQIRGKPVDARTDVYSLGCVVIECLSGSPPFAGRQGMQLLWAHLREDPGDPCAGRDDASAELGRAVANALEKEPAGRPPTPTAYARMVEVASGMDPPSG